MSEQSDPKPRKRRTRRIARGFVIGVLVMIGVLLIAAALLYLNRREAARQILVGWLEDRGIEAEVDVERIELDGFVGKIRIGDPKNPEVTVERVEVDYAIGLPWSASGLGVKPSRIRLVRPVLRASWIDGKLSFGSLDPLIKEFTGKPPQPDSTSPLVIIEQGRARLTTEYGPVDALADARVDNGKLMMLDLRVPEAALKSGDFSARIEAAALDVDTVGDRTRVTLGAAVRQLESPGYAVRDADISLSGDLPYPDAKEKRGDGAATLTGGIKAAMLRTGDASARDASVGLSFDGRIEGWLETFRVDGDLSANVKAGGLTTPTLTARDAVVSTQSTLSIDRSVDDLEWKVEGPATLNAASGSTGGTDLSGLTLRSERLLIGGRGNAWEASGPVTVAANRVALGDISLNDVTGRLAVDMIDDAGLNATFTGNLASRRAAWPVLGSAQAGDAPELKSLKTAFSAFSLDVPRVRLALGPGGVQADLLAPVTARPASGGSIVLTPSGRPVYAARSGELGGGGGLTLTADGGGLPTVRAGVDQWRQTANGFTAGLDLDARLDFDLIRNARVKTSGTLTAAGPVTTFSTRDCAIVEVERLELNENDAEALAGSLCPSGGPLLTLKDGGWSARGTLADTSATVPFLAMRFTGIDGPLAISGSEAGLGMDIGIQRATVTDTTDPKRFNPLTASGQVGLTDDRWTGGFNLALGDYPLGTVALAHNGAAEAGGVVFNVPELTFAPDGLQPQMVTPLAETVIGSPVTGSAAFEGTFDWTSGGVTSGGTVTIPRLDFISPVGAVTGLSGTVELTSLTPLTTAPEQRLFAEQVATFAPLTNVELVFELGGEAVTVSAADLKAAGGTISIEPFSLPLDPKAPFSGVLVLERVQLGEVVKASSFADKVEMDALVSGRLPFTSDPVNGFQVANGLIYAVQPGSLSIRREALTQMSAGGGGEAVPPNTVQDLAYQAMEHLAFTQLDATVNSLAAGRLGVLFHIVGSHQPPEQQELRLTVQELISREFLNRELPLPSGTQIDLTLDTTLNINELLGDYLAWQRARAGEGK